MSEAPRGEPRRLFITANVLLLIVAGLHTFGALSQPTDPADLELISAMKNRIVPVGLGWTPSTFDIFRSLALIMTINLVGMVLVNLGMLAFSRSQPGLLRRLSLLNVLVLTAIVALSLAYRIAPPFVTLAVVDALFLIAWLKARPTTAS